MNIKFICTLLVIASSYYGYSQRLSMKIGNNPTSKDASAVVEIESTTKGFLPPRMTNVDRDAIVTPAKGLIVWCTNCGRNGQLQIFNGTDWTNMSGGFAQFPIIVEDGNLNTFMTHNLGADTDAPPLTPSWRLNGAYFQWGRKPIDTNGDWFISKLNEGGSGFVAAPTGADATKANSSNVGSWSTSIAPNDAWQSTSTEGFPLKASSDPCPAGWRIPTNNEWISYTGWSNVAGASWTDSPTNYTSGKLLNNRVYFPAAGYRDDFNGSLQERGISGYYWSSTSSGSLYAFAYVFDGFTNGSLSQNDRKIGCSIRCVQE